MNKTTVNGTPSQIPAFELTKASAKFEVATSNCLWGDAFTRKYIITLLTLTLGQGQTRNVAQYPLHHMTYGLCACKVWSCYVQRFRRKCIYKKYFIWPWPKVKVTWSIAPYIMWPMYLQSLKLLQPMVKEMHYQEGYWAMFCLTLTPRLRSKNVFSCKYIS